MGFGQLGIMAGADLLGGALGGLFGGGGGTSPLVQQGYNLMNTGAGNLGNAYSQYANMYGAVSPYLNNAMAQGQQATQNLLGIYNNPQGYLTNLRNTTALGQFMPGGYSSQNAINTAGAYANAANRGLGSAASGGAPSTLTGANLYNQNAMNNLYGQGQFQLGQMQANLPLQFGQAAQNLATGNAANLFGQASGLTGAEAGIGQNQMSQGLGEEQAGFGQGAQYAGMKNQAIGGMLGGIGNILGMQNASKMFGYGLGGAMGGGIGGGAIPAMGGAGGDMWGGVSPDEWLMMTGYNPQDDQQFPGG